MSPSPKPGARSRSALAPPARSRYVAPFVLIAVLAVLAVIIIALPASMLKRYLPAGVNAQDFSGTVWHGSVGTITANGVNLGAVEWHLHPGALLHLTLPADLRWVKGGFVADGKAEVTRRDVTLHDVRGAGPIEDLADLGLPAGWHGMASFTLGELKATWTPARLVTAIGDVSVSNLMSREMAGGTDLGGYTLHLANGAITPDTDASAELRDTGGPLEVRATLHLSADGGTVMLSGTVKERPDAPPALRAEMEKLEQLQVRDAQGRLPVELEFTL
ncbi:MAG: type II secretion system protein N [Pseudomonadota bacterium]|nr:type II secretion system protein N [Pseudomonadota bacterium]